MMSSRDRAANAACAGMASPRNIAGRTDIVPIRLGWPTSHTPGTGALGVAPTVGPGSGQVIPDARLLDPVRGCSRIVLFVHNLEQKRDKSQRRWSSTKRIPGREVCRHLLRTMNTSLLSGRSISTRNNDGKAESPLLCMPATWSRRRSGPALASRGQTVHPSPFSDGADGVAA